MTNESNSSIESEANLALWRSVETTPPDMTKLVSYGKRKYTTIDAYYQLREATSLWGPYGDRWGMRNITYQVVPLHCKDAGGEFVCHSIILRAEFFYPLDGKQVSFEILNDDEYEAGEETLKKLVTNTRSKALSLLGFSADVFTGKFDDSKYVETLKQIYEDEDAFKNNVITTVMAAKNMAAIEKCSTRLDEIVGDGQLKNASTINELRGLIAQRRKELSPREKA